MAQYDLLLTQNVHATLIEYSEKFVNISKGGLLSAVADQTPTVLAGGTDGYILARDDVETTGLKWIDAGSLGVTVANQANDRVVTATASADALNAEANLTYNDSQGLYIGSGLGILFANATTTYQIYTANGANKASIDILTGTNSAGGAGDVTLKAGAGTAAGGNVYLQRDVTYGNFYIGTGAAGHLPARSTETNVVYYDTTTGLLTYDTVASTSYFSRNSGESYLYPTTAGDNIWVDYGSAFYMGAANNKMEAVSTNQIRFWTGGVNRLSIGVSGAYVTVENSDLICGLNGQVGDATHFWYGMYSSDYTIDNVDTIIARDGSGNMTFVDGVTSVKTLAELSASTFPYIVDDASTNTQIEIAEFRRTSSGTPASNIGGYLTLSIEGADSTLSYSRIGLTLAEAGTGIESGNLWVTMPRGGSPSITYLNLNADTAYSSYGVEAVSIGYLATGGGSHAIAIGYHTGAGGSGSLALGDDASADGQSGIAIGRLAEANADDQVSIGLGSGDATTPGEDAVAVGHGAGSGTTQGAASVAVGYSAYAAGDYSVAIGFSPDATGAGSISLGMYNVASAQGSIIMGYSYASVQTNSLAESFELNWNATIGFKVGMTLGVQMTSNANPDTNLTDAVNGVIAYDSTDHEFRAYINGSWTGLATGGATPWTHDTGGIYYSSGNVGIGAGSDGSYPLLVASSTYPKIKLHLDSDTDTGDPTINFWTGTTAAQKGVLGYNRGADTMVFLYGSSANNETGFIVNSSGEAGIGDAPTSGQALTVGGSLTVRGSALFYSNTDIDTRFTVSGGSAQYVSLYYWEEGTSTMRDVRIGESGVNTGIYWDSSLNRCGINDDTPSYVLDVNGTFRVTGTALFASSVTFSNYIYQGDNDRHIWGTGNDYEIYFTGAHLYIDDNGATSGADIKFTTAASVRFTFDMDVYKGTAVDWIATSDIRLKTNIRPFTLRMDKLGLLASKAVRFNWREGAGDVTAPEIGFIAQDVEEIYPEFVNIYKEKPHYRALSYNKMVTLAITGASQAWDLAVEVKSEVDQLKDEVKELKNQLNTLQNG